MRWPWCRAFRPTRWAQDGAEQLSGLWTTAGLFRVFGVSPFLGRGFTEDETVAAGDPPVAVGHVVIISHALWQQRFASDPNVIGKTFVLYGGISKGDRRHAQGVSCRNA